MSLETILHHQTHQPLHICIRHHRPRDTRSVPSLWREINLRAFLRLAWKMKRVRSVSLTPSNTVMIIMILAASRSTRCRRVPLDRHRLHRHHRPRDTRSVPSLWREINLRAFLRLAWKMKRVRSVSRTPSNTAKRTTMTWRAEQSGKYVCPAPYHPRLHKTFVLMMHRVRTRLAFSRLAWTAWKTQSHAKSSYTDTVTRWRYKMAICNS
jgi:hypothetical protein